MNLAADYQALFLAMAHKMSVQSQYTKHGVESLLDDLERFTDKRLRGRRRRKAFDAINLIRENYDQDTARLTMATIDPDYTVDELFKIYSDCQVFYMSVIRKTFGLKSMETLYIPQDHIRSLIESMREGL